MKKVIFAALAALVVLSGEARATAQYQFTPDGLTTVENIGTSGVAIGKGKTAASAALDVVGSQLLSGRLSTARTALSGIQASTTVLATSAFETVLSTGGSVLLLSTPNITVSGVPDGTRLVIVSTSTTGPIVFQDEGTLTGSKLELGAASRSVSGNSALSLIFDSVVGKWKETSYSAN